MAFYLALLSLFFVGCANLKSFTRSKHKIIPTEGMSAYITSMDCNRQSCIKSSHQLHAKLEKSLKSMLENKGTKIINEKSKADLNFYFITAHEEKIERQTPRNVHLIVQKPGGEEVLQIGISEAFSSPITSSHINLSAVNEKFQSKFMPFIEPRPVISFSK